MSEAVTQGVRIRVNSEFVPERSNPMQPLYFFAYHVTISNEGAQAVQLLNRHWKIRDAFRRIEEVRGPGVVGRQPRLSPGESFEYTSYCPLPTEFGSMEGSYEMAYDDGASFEARIAPFQLVAPQAVN
ncbi:MAG: Co2+/Mg2+ efflux protein ApaG [Leptospirales bacterium]|nr:Co2+/Mg2+ efflux protein ApaG [Leptospirales bacterium]